jgi:hypothetical protein
VGIFFAFGAGNLTPEEDLQPSGDGGLNCVVDLVCNHADWLIELIGFRIEVTIIDFLKKLDL